MSAATEALPAYLKRFVSEQDYDGYTAQDHAAWRYIMRQNCAFFSRHGVPVYLEGLKKTGIHLERIPRISEIDACLSKFGWGAVAVEGFIPPAAFLDFQARSVLPIACDMRTVQHIAYTPAPDIVHEAAGHAPILSFAPYARYLSRYAGMAQKAIFSAEDVRLYEAIRYLSDIKENPDASADEIVQAERRLQQVTQSLRHVSEAAKVARMNWWTVEYGLVGDVKNPRIYGAGLLSSVGESQNCLSEKVRKIPLSVDCVETSYNITEPQPQLFVARDMDQLVDVLEEFEKTLAFRTGGLEGLEKAKEAETVTTTVLDSGLEVSGQLVEFIVDKKAPVFVRYQGPVQLALGGQQLAGHGRERHGQGFSSPLGKLKKPFPKPKQKGEVAFDSGFRVEGLFLGTTQAADGTSLLATWTDCQVTRGSQTYFQPEWGEFDLALGERVVSVYGGPSDWAAYGALDVGKASSTPGRTSPFSASEKKLFDLYTQIRLHRESGTGDLEALCERALHDFSAEWLPILELLELSLGANPQRAAKLETHLDILEKQADTEKRELIRKGRELARAR